MSDNPFLLPPSGAAPPSKPLIPDTGGIPAPATDRDAGASAPAHYIAVPASVESATHRNLRPAVPALAQAAEPAPEQPCDAVGQDTRLAPAPPPSPNDWALLLPDGTRVPLTGPLLLGRNPAGIPDRPDAELRALTDPAKTVSKTHALLESAPDGVRVRELHSTNGVTVDTAGVRRTLSRGGEVTVPLGSTVMLGSFPICIAAG